MDKHLFFLLAVTAALLCGCSVQKEPEPKATHTEITGEVSAQKSPSAPVAPSGQSVICSSQVLAYNPSDPSKKLGFFKAGSELHISDGAAAPGMVLVTYQDPSGPLITALCRAEDVGMAPPSSQPAASIASSQPQLVKPRSLGGSRPAQSNPNYKPIGGQ